MLWETATERNQAVLEFLSRGDEIEPTHRKKRYPASRKRADRAPTVMTTRFMPERLPLFVPILVAGDEDEDEGEVMIGFRVGDSHRHPTVHMPNFFSVFVGIWLYKLHSMPNLNIIPATSDIQPL
jgi:hypothetical protein